MATSSLEIGTGWLHAMDKTGDTKVMWDRSKPDEVATAREMYDKLRKKGYRGYSVTGKDGEKGTVLNEFDPSAERIIMALPVVGG
jgi:hypothetical protein